MVGAPGDPIRAFLFAHQSLDELLSRTRTDSAPDGSVWADLTQAREFLQGRQTAEAEKKLKEALGREGLECRMRLWIWTALRSVGVAPESRDGEVVRGAVIEVPTGGGVDVLAAYEDGTARYINYTGRSIFWDARDEKVTALCRAFLAEAQKSAAQSSPKNDYSPPSDQRPILTLLTYGGNRLTTDVPESTLMKGALLMNHLIRHVLEGKQPDGG